MGNEELRGTKDECLSQKAKKQVKKLCVSLKSSIFAAEIDYYHVKQHSHPSADALHHPPAVHAGSLPQSLPLGEAGRGR